MSVYVNSETKNYSISDLLKKIQDIKTDNRDKNSLLSNIIKTDQCSEQDFQELVQDIEKDLGLLEIYETEIINRNYQTVVFDNKTYKIIELIKYKMVLGLKLDLSNIIINASSKVDNNVMIKHSLDEFKKSRNYQDQILQINKILSQFNNKK